MQIERLHGCPAHLLLSLLRVRCYLRRRLACGEGIMTLGVTLSRCVCVRRISLDGEGNALYPLSSAL